MYAVFSYYSVCGLTLLLYEAFSYSNNEKKETILLAKGCLLLELLVYEAFSYSDTYYLYEKKETIMLAKGCVVLDDEDEEDSKGSKHSAGMRPEATSV